MVLELTGTLHAKDLRCNQSRSLELWGISEEPTLSLFSSRYCNFSDHVQNKVPLNLSLKTRTTVHCCPILWAHLNQM